MEDKQRTNKLTMNDFERALKELYESVNDSRSRDPSKNVERQIEQFYQDFKKDFFQSNDKNRQYEVIKKIGNITPYTNLNYDDLRNQSCREINGKLLSWLNRDISEGIELEVSAIHNFIDSLPPIEEVKGKSTGKGVGMALLGVLAAAAAVAPVVAIATNLTFFLANPIFLGLVIGGGLLVVAGAVAGMVGLSMKKEPLQEDSNNTLLKCVGCPPASSKSIIESVTNNQRNCHRDNPKETQRVTKDSNEALNSSSTIRPGNR